MDHLVQLAFIGALAYAAVKSLSGRQTRHESVPATSIADEPTAAPTHLNMVDYLTVEVDDPQKLRREIADKTTFLRREGHIIGTPQITADGCTAQVPIYKRI
jgi:hypothetical protein